MSARFPHTFVLLFVLIAFAAATTHFIPAGAYDRVVRDGREVVDPGSYHPLPPRPAGWPEVLLAYPRGLIATAPIVVYIFLIGGAFGVLQATGAIEAALAALVRASGGRGPLALALLLFVFALGGGTIGLAEETLPFIPPLVLLARRLGYDETTGAAIALVGAGAGFSGAFINPFTVGVGQAIAGLPLFSGMGYRLIVWAVLTALAIAYVEWYARRIRVPEAAGPGDEVSAAPARANLRQRVVLALLGATIAILVVGAMRWSWGLLELSGLFVGLAIAAGLAGGLGANGTADRFLEGAAAIVPGALVVGLARGVLVIFDGAQVTDTILHALVETVRALPTAATLTGMYGVQVVLSYVVPSGSGQAALSLPILVPLGDLVGRHPADQRSRLPARRRLLQHPDPDPGLLHGGAGPGRHPLDPLGPLHLAAPARLAGRRPGAPAGRPRPRLEVGGRGWPGANGLAAPGATAASAEDLCASSQEVVGGSPDASQDLEMQYQAPRMSYQPLRVYPERLLPYPQPFLHRPARQPRRLSHGRGAKSHGRGGGRPRLVLSGGRRGASGRLSRAWRCGIRP